MRDIGIFFNAWLNSKKTYTYNGSCVLGDRGGMEFIPFCRGKSEHPVVAMRQKKIAANDRLSLDISIRRRINVNGKVSQRLYRRSS